MGLGLRLHGAGTEVTWDWDRGYTGLGLKLPRAGTEATWAGAQLTAQGGLSRPRQHEHESNQVGQKDLVVVQT